MSEIELNNLIDLFVELYNDDIKQKDNNWYQLMGTTVGGSEIAALIGLNPYTSFYDVVESKLEICKGIRSFNTSNSISCWWGTLFEKVIEKYISIDLGNKVKGTNICIQKYEGHRNSPDGYVVVNLYLKDGVYNIWTTDLPKELIDIRLIFLLEFKCPITRKTTGQIPKYYKPQVLSGLDVSPIAHKGLFIDAVFKKCSLHQLKFNSQYDTSFHKKTMELIPIAIGVIPIFIPLTKITNDIKEIYEEYFNIEFVQDSKNIIDLGDISINLFHKIMNMINIHDMFAATSSVHFFDGRGDEKITEFQPKQNCILFALLPWKLFDVSYIPVDREYNFLENIYPIIQKVHALVRENLNNNLSMETIKITDICNNIYE